MLDDVMSGLEPEPATADELYETYRKGLIRRHICMNGRLDQVTWLRQYSPASACETWFQQRLLRNHRRRREEFVDPASGETKTADFHWRPMHHEQGDPSRVPVSRGGGDNPLLHGGLALAVFSLESSLGVSSQSSLRYAHQLFGYFVECEIPGDRRGCLLRKNSAGIASELASLDEMLGVCIGLLFYLRSLDTHGETSRACQVREFVQRIARAMDEHGFWLLPFADDLASAKARGYLSPHFTPEMGTAVGFMFAYPFWLFFRAALGSECPSMDCHWSGSEFKRYFPEYLLDSNNILDKKWMLIAQAAEKAEPTSWDYLQNTLVGAGVGALFGPIGAALGGLLGFGGTAATDVNLEWDEKNFFVNTLKLAENYFDPAGNIARQAFRLVADECGAERNLDEKFFNLDLLALASIMALECKPDDSEIRDQVGATFGTLMEAFTITQPLPTRGSVEVAVGRYNAIFGILARRGRHHHSGQDSTQEKQLEQDAFEILRRWPPVLESEWKTFQHDLPLARFPLIELLQQAVGLEQVAIRPGFGVDIDEYGRRCRVSWMRGEITRRLGDRANDWWDRFRNQGTPGNFNPRNQWGVGNCWQHMWWPDSCTAFEKPSHVMFGQTWGDHNELRFTPKAMSAETFAADLADERFDGQAITMEGDGLDLLFPSMLAALWSIAPVPTLSAAGRETLWPTLPYLGASPKGEWLGGLAASIVDDHHGESGRWPQKELVGLRRRNAQQWVRITSTAGGLRRSEVPHRPPLIFGGEFLVLNERFRGTRRHRYTEVQPRLRMMVASCNPDWNFYVELADRKSILCSTPTWQPVSLVAHDPDLHVIRSRLRGNADMNSVCLRLDEIEPKSMLSTLDSSIYFWCIHARLPIPYESVGNEAFEFRTVGARPLWWRQNCLPPATSRCRLFLNPHQGTVHDVSNPQTAHWQGSLRAFNCVWLPVTRPALSAQPNLDAALLSILTSGELGAITSNRQLHLRGRNIYFEAREDHLVNFNSTHPAQQERHKGMNRRDARWCSYCRNCAS